MMLRSSLILAIFCGWISLSTSSVALGEDQDVLINDTIQGKLRLPTASPKQAVLLLHGWNGSMDEVGNLYADLAEELAQRGIASLRFDFSGEGERENFLVTSTLQSRISESRAAFELLRSRVPDANYGVVGFSLGGLTAMEMVGQHPDWFQSMVLWSAAQEMRMAGEPGYNAAIQTAVADGRGTFTSYAEITMTREFVLSFVGVNASQHLANFPGALLSIRGDADYLPSHDRAWLELAPTTDKSFLLIGGADHIFNVLEQPRPNYGARAIRATADWMQRTLR